MRGMESERKRECAYIYFILGVREITHKSNNPHGRRSRVWTTKGYAKFSEGHPVDI